MAQEGTPPRGRPCPKCREPMRVQVSLFLDIPSELESALSKRNLRSAAVKVLGAGWDRMSWYCPRGHHHGRVQG